MVLKIHHRSPLSTLCFIILYYNIILSIFSVQFHMDWDYNEVSGENTVGLLGLRRITSGLIWIT